MAPPKQASTKRSVGGGGRGGAAAAKAKGAKAVKRKAAPATTPKAKRPRKEVAAKAAEEGEKEEEEEDLVEDAEDEVHENGHVVEEEEGEDEDEEEEEKTPNGGDDHTTGTEEDEEEQQEEEEEEEEEEEVRPKPTAKPKKQKQKQKKKAPTPAKASQATPKAKAKASKASKPKAVKPKKRKTAADKVRENAPLNAPFFEETGAEWAFACVELEELGELRAMWELPAACHVLWLLQAPLTLRVCNTLLEYEAALLSPESSTLLEDVFTKLLLKKSERDCLAPGIGLKYEWWNKQLREYYMALYDQWYALLRKAGEKTPASFLLDSEEEEDDDDDDDDDDEDDEDERDVELSDDEWLTLDILKSRLEGLGVECPLRHQSFADLSVVLRCKILLNLCEAVVEDPANSDYIRQMEDDDLRVEPLGRDRLGNLFFYFPQFYNERRVYRLELETNKWQLWAKGDAAFAQMLAALRQLRGRKARGEQELLDHLEVIVEQIGEEAEARARELDRATKKAILEAIPRKRSMRIQVKQIEQMEKAKEDEETKRALTLEEMAELKRAELLRKVDQDAERERREREREARRAAQDEAEKEAALAERELRRQRRLEKEKEEELQAARAEEARRRQEEARKLRALQRKAAEDEEEQNGSGPEVADKDAEKGGTHPLETSRPDAHK